MTRILVSASLRHEVDRLFDSLIHSTWAHRAGEASWLPASDVSEDPAHYRIELDLPGVSPAGVCVTTEGQNLKVEGTRERLRRGTAERYHTVERSAGRFVRNFRLPDDADLHAVVARLEEGVLTVEIRRNLQRRGR